jgi:amino-acid N-acetyltransferase
MALERRSLGSTMMKISPERKQQLPRSNMKIEPPTAVTDRITVRKAKLEDANDILNLVNSLSHDGTLLRRTYREVYDNIDTFVVAESATGQFQGCAALYFYGSHLAEVRSIAVHSEARGQGAGRLLLEALLKRAEEHEVHCVCLFTRIPDFFLQYNFRTVSRTVFPEKFRKDCYCCSRRNACDEIAMAWGELPSNAHMEPVFRNRNLVQLHA